jgi:hypothetical protein
MGAQRFGHVVSFTADGVLLTKGTTNGRGYGMRWRERERLEKGHFSMWAVGKVTRCVWGKNRPNCCPIFCQNYYASFTVAKSSQKCGLLLKFTNKIPDVNNQSKGENSSNPVTLAVRYIEFVERQKIVSVVGS